MNVKGGMNDAIEAVMLLLMFLIVFYTVMVIWQPITTLNLYPLLENADTFTHGGTAVTLLQLVPLIIVASVLIAFFNHARGAGRPPPTYAY